MPPPEDRLDLSGLFHVEQRQKAHAATIASMIDPLVGPMERKMKKTLMIVASAVVAAATSLSPAAQAKGGGGHSGGGGMKLGGSSAMKFSSGPSQNHHPHFRVFRRDTIVTPVYKAEEVTTKRIKPVLVSAAPIIRYADGNGHVYDVASKVWCDGNKHCWTGQLVWAYRDGTWFYGTSRWYEADGVWKTDAADGPTAVDCETIPVFASLKPTTEQQVARSDGESEPSRDTPAVVIPVKTVDKSPATVAAKPADCKKYFPSVGEMVSVPCEG
jgi:hypothetical protein